MLGPSTVGTIGVVGAFCLVLDNVNLQSNVMTMAYDYGMTMTYGLWNENNRNSLHQFLVCINFFNQFVTVGTRASDIDLTNMGHLTKPSTSAISDGTN